MFCLIHQLGDHGLDRRAHDGASVGDFPRHVDRKARIAAVGNTIELAADENRKFKVTLFQILLQRADKLQGDAIVRGESDEVGARGLSALSEVIGIGGGAALDNFDA